MKEELSQVTAEAMKALMENLTQAKGFILEQAPDVLREMVLLGRIKYTAAFVFGALMLCVGIYSTWQAILWDRIFRKEHGTALEREARTKGEFYPIPAFVGWALGLLFSLLATSPMLTAWFAPKVYLLEQVTKMLK